MVVLWPIITSIITYYYFCYYVIVTYYYGPIITYDYRNLVIMGSLLPIITRSINYCNK